MIGDKVNQINRNMIDTHHQVESFTPQHPNNSENGNYYNLGISPNSEAIAGSGRKVGGSLYSRAKSAASKVYNVGKNIYDTGKYIYDEAGNLYKKPVSRGLHLASKVAEHYGYGKKRGGMLKHSRACGRGLPNYPMSSGELGMMGNGKIADYMQLGSNLAGYTPIPYLDKALGVGSTLARFAGFGRSGGRRHNQPMDGGMLKHSRACGAGSSGGRRRKGAGTFSDIAHGVGSVAGAFGLGRSGGGSSGGGSSGGGSSGGVGPFDIATFKKKGGGPFGGIAHGVGDVLGAFGLGKRKKGKGVLPKNIDKMLNSFKGIADIKMSPEQMTDAKAFMNALPEPDKKKGRGMKLSDALKLAGTVNPALGVAGSLAGAFGLGKKKGRKGPVHPEEYAMVDKHTSRGSYSGSGKPKRVNKRAEIVKKVMREHNCSMIDASKYVKAHNLY
jgi:hypothetical protein